MKSLSLISAPLDLGAENLGVDIGPDAFRHAGIITKLEGTGLEVQDAGTIEVADRQSTVTGNIHGMHLASLMGFGAKELVNVYGEGAKLPKENLLHVGGSDFDQPELDLILSEHLNAYTLFDVLTKGLGELIDRINELSERVPNIWISLDLDSIDRIYAPGAGMPNAKGLTYREIATLAEYIGTHCNIVGIDVVEYNPLQDEQSKTAELGIELIAKFLGRNYSWYTNYLGHNQIG